MAEATEDKSDTKIQFFSEIDCDDKTGAIRSQMPCWYFDAQINELRETINRKERGLERNLFAPDQIMRIQEEVKAERARLKQIEGSKPSLGVHKDRCANAYNSLGQQIRDAMPTRKQAKDGLVSPHKELERLNGRHFKLDPMLAKACGVNAIRGQITGKDAEKCYKILGRSLNENTNTEALRRDGNSEAFQSMNDLTQAILSGKPIKGT